MKKIFYFLLALILCACGYKSNNKISNVSSEESTIEDLFQETDRVQEIVIKRALRDSTYYDLLDVDFDGTDEWLYRYIAGAYAIVTYDVYELCGDSLVLKHAKNEVHDHFFVDQNTRFDTINKQIINHANSGCCTYVEYVYQADERGSLILIYDESVEWDPDKHEPISKITYYQ